MSAAETVLPADVVEPTGFLHTLLSMSLTAVAVLRPLYHPTQAVIQDFAWVSLNEAGQRMLQQPEHPSLSLLTLFPTAKADGVFAKCCLAYETGERQHSQTNYQADGLDGYFLLVAQRYENVLVVNFTDTNDQPRTPVEQALRESQTREQEARAEAELRRQQLHHVLEQAPAMICIFDGPTHIFQFVNPPYQALVGDRPLIGKPIAEAMPELTGQPIFALLDQVYQTGETYYAHEMLVQLDHANEGRTELEKRYYNFIYQARRDVTGTIDGILVFAYEVTPQVQARQQVEQLNHELEARVQERTRQLRQQSQRLERLVQEAPAAIALLDGPNLVFELLNEDYQALFPERTLLGKPVVEALPELLNTPLGEVLQQVYHTGETFEGQEFPIPFVGPDGQEQNRYFDFIYQARYDVAGAIDGILVFGFDVTERVQRRQQTEMLQTQLLASAEQRARLRQDVLQVFQQAPLAVLVMRGSTHVVDYINDYGIELIEGREIIGKPLAEVLPNMLNQGFIPLLDQVYHTGKTQRGQEVLLLADQPDGQPPQPYYFTYTYQAYEEEGQRVGVAIFATEVSQQVAARQAIEAGAQRLRLLTDALPVLIGYLDQERRYQFANEAYRAWFNQDPAALLGRHVWDIVGEQAYAAAAGYIDRALAGERVSFEATMPYRPDFTRHIRTDFIPDVQAGAVVGFYTLVTDVTEQVVARQQVEALNQELQARNALIEASNAQLTHANADLDTFIYTASHDLRMPVANIDGLVTALRQELREEAVTTCAVEYILDLMDNAVARFQTTIGHLTDIVHQQQGWEQGRQRIDVAAMVEDIRLDLAPLLAAAQAELQVTVEECPVLHGSPKDVRSIIFNLLSNALKYHDPARPARVHLHTTCNAQWAELCVQDNGLGLTAEQQGKLFGLFTRLHDHVDGSGVGLYSIKRLVENRGGSIRVESEVGVGSTFRVQLPV
ncbi:PAS domain-containing sensor histidine kinase [Hymenobacter fodinae]|uniref:histidine kinase n=1 Tax=Hymenobacter fodinae TaxID=2510796 RepID=A0A4Z0PCZ2_9BACT|nr:PAS domain-containing protein [Hymenobacter fodinae]TGE10078.1 PAS domain S-box protein [Hymenobacter fodinae]